MATSPTPPHLHPSSANKLTFSSLPQEIQNEIWDMAIATQLTEGRILCIAPDPLIHTRTLETAKTAHFHILRSTTHPISIPSLLHVSHYTRAQSLPHYTLWPLASEETYEPLPRAKIYINKATDTFVFRSESYNRYWFLDTIVGAAIFNNTRDSMQLTRDEARIHFLAQLAKIKNYALDIHLLFNIFQHYNSGPSRLFTAFGASAPLQITIMISQSQPQSQPPISTSKPTPSPSITSFQEVAPNTLLHRCSEAFLAGFEQHYEQASAMARTMETFHDPGDVLDVREFAARIERDSAVESSVTPELRAFRLLALRRMMHTHMPRIGDSNTDFRVMMAVSAALDEAGAGVESGGQDGNTLANLKLIDTMI